MISTITETMDETLLEEPGAKIRFTQRERRGVFLGLRLSQLVVACGGLLFLLAVVLIDPGGIGIGLLVSLAVLVLACSSWRREPVLTLLWQSVAYLQRAATKQTQFRRDVWWRVSTTALPDGNPPERVPVPVRFKTMALPGGLGDVQLVDIPGRGGFVFNAKEHLAALTITVSSQAWKLLDAGKKEAAYEGFTAWMSSLETMPGLVEAVVRVRVDRAAATELVDYVKDRELRYEPNISDELRNEYYSLITSEGSRSLEFGNTITLAFDADALKSDIRDSGGGLSGLGAILADRTQALEDSLDSLQVENGHWLTAEEIDATIGTTLDPVTAATRREKYGNNTQQRRSRPPVMSIDETRTHLRVDQSWHQTLWITEWPRTQVRTGFLEKLMYAGDATRCITLQFRPVPLHKAMKEVAGAQTDMEGAENIRLKFNGRSTVQHKREKQDLDRREEELADGFTDVRFRGFVTVSADSEDALRRARTGLEQAAVGSHLSIAVMHAQQWSAFVTSTLPIPTGGRRGK